MENGRPAWVWFRELFDATDEIVCIYVNAYILMLLSSQLFADKNANRVHLRWLPYLASLDDLGRYSWGSAALAWLYRCPCRGTNRNVVNLAGPLQLLQSWIFWRFLSLRPSGFDIFGFPLTCRWAEYLPRNDTVDQRVVAARLCLDRLRVHDFVWEPYSSPKVGAVVHPEILVDEHRRLWTVVTSLIYFSAIRQGSASSSHWEDRLDTIILVDRVADPGPSAEYLDWWCHVAHRFLSLEVAFQDLRPIVLTEEARHRGSVQVLDRLDNRRVDRRRRIGTRTTDREWRWLDDRLDEDLAGADHGGVVDYRVPRRRARRQGGRDGSGRARGRGPSAEDDSAQHAVGEDVGGVATWMDQPTYDVGGTSQFVEYQPPSHNEGPQYQHPAPFCHSHWHQGWSRDRGGLGVLLCVAPEVTCLVISTMTTVTPSRILISYL
ncbi:hypothetical protein Ahy_A10g047628 [Arachis hypogaea]|uniref:Aminotransferase-like plant mobile domain-containing protein n=1 Tax=Arachis hypogaea TaxID=3818 RepID=A0A445B312_ARAHY|nr:hypothetical protein Ahy_A10g047628 [Arachis hypogaea]